LPTAVRRCGARHSGYRQHTVAGQRSSHV
jgi:hypothetical protein